jgi:hypothetical protein
MGFDVLWFGLFAVITVLAADDVPRIQAQPEVEHAFLFTGTNYAVISANLMTYPASPGLQPFSPFDLSVETVPESNRAPLNIQPHFFLLLHTPEYFHPHANPASGLNVVSLRFWLG